MKTRIAAGRAPVSGREAPLRVAVLGATGYVGGELVRLLQRHPDVRIAGLGARNRAGVPIGEAFAHLAETGHVIESELPDHATLDAVFLALPHGQAASIAPPLLERGLMVVDLGPDFRLADPADYPAWYGFEHPAPELLPGGVGRGDIAAAVYGLPELHRTALAGTRLVASPGCYPTATLLALAPLAGAGLIDDLVVDAKSGVSGAGREPKLETHFGEVNESVRAYGLGGHRHYAEIRQELAGLGVGADALRGLVFTPHLVPMTRGLLATCYVRPVGRPSQADIDALYRSAYEAEPCVAISPTAPATKTVTGANLARVFARLDERSGRIVAIGAIDNLVKGAAGQAVQAFNVAAGLPETAGLEQLPLYP
ncbi:MAG: N-acetyl-gamma-glutamyl-phosphate reductase [Candidatus Limnocylindrales bacterium]